MKIDGLKNLSDQLFDEDKLLDKKDTSFLKHVVEQMMAEDLKSALEIRKRIKTDVTFERSLGFIYEYLKAKEICKNCKGKLDLCPMQSKGANFGLLYDPDNDLIRSYRQPCEYQREREHLLERISPMDLDGRTFLSDVESFNKIAQSDTRQYETTLKTLLTLRRDIADPSNSKMTLIYGIKGISLPNLALRYGAYVSAKKGLKTAYVKAEYLFAGLMSHSESEYANTISDFKDIINADCVFIEDIASMPFISLDVASSYLFQMIKNQKERGQVFYMSSSSSATLTSLIRKTLSQSVRYGEAIELVDGARYVTIEDVDLR